jgi:hypothetical protein
MYPSPTTPPEWNTTAARLAEGATLAQGERQLGRLDALLSDPARRRRYIADAARREILATITREGGILDWRDLVIGQLDPAWLPVLRRTQSDLDSALDLTHAIAWVLAGRASIGSVPESVLPASSGLDGSETAPEPGATSPNRDKGTPIAAETAAQAAWRAVAELEAFLADPTAPVAPIDRGANSTTALSRPTQPGMRPSASVLSRDGLAALASHLAPEAPADAFAEAIDAILVAAARAGPGLGGLLEFLADVDSPPPTPADSVLSLDDALAQRLRSERGLAGARLARLAASAVLRQTCQLAGAGPFITPLLDRGAIAGTLSPSRRAAALAEGLGRELDRVRALDAIAADWARAVSDIRADSRIHAVVALLFEEPAITAKRLQVRLGLSVRASHLAVAALVRRRVLKEVSGRRWFRVFVADALDPERPAPLG